MALWTSTPRRRPPLRARGSITNRTIEASGISTEISKEIFPSIATSIMFPTPAGTPRASASLTSRKRAPIASSRPEAPAGAAVKTVASASPPSRERAGDSGRAGIAAWVKAFCTRSIGQEVWRVFSSRSCSPIMSSRGSRASSLVFSAREVVMVVPVPSVFRLTSLARRSVSSMSAAIVCGSGLAQALETASSSASAGWPSWSARSTEAAESR